MLLCTKREREVSLAVTAAAAFYEFLHKFECQWTFIFRTSAGSAKHQWTVLLAPLDEIFQKVLPGQAEKPTGRHEALTPGRDFPGVKVSRERG